MCLKINVQLYKKLPFTDKKTIKDAHRYAILFLCLKSYMNITFNSLLKLMLNTVKEDASIRENTVENVSIFNTEFTNKGKSEEFREEFFKGLNMFIGYMYDKKYINLIEVIGVPMEIFGNYNKMTFLSYQLQYLQSIKHVRVNISIFLCIIILMLEKQYPNRPVVSIISDVLFHYNLPDSIINDELYFKTKQQLEPFYIEYNKLLILIHNKYHIHQLLSINSLGPYFLSLRKNTDMYQKLVNTDDISETIDTIVVYIITLKEHSSINLGILLSSFQINWDLTFSNKKDNDPIFIFKRLITTIFNDNNEKIKFYKKVERFLMYKYDKKYKEFLFLLNVPTEIENNTQYNDILVQSLNFIRQKEHKKLPLSYIFGTIVYFYMKTSIPEFNIPYIVYNTNGTLLKDKELEQNKLNAIISYLQRYYNFPLLYYDNPVKIYDKISSILNDFVMTT
jgi:hypothetical protein